MHAAHDFPIRFLASSLPKCPGQNVVSRDIKESAKGLRNAVANVIPPKPTTKPSVRQPESDPQLEDSQVQCSRLRQEEEVPWSWQL